MRKKSQTGYNVGADATYIVWQNDSIRVGAGGFVRFTQADMNVEMLTQLAADQSRRHAVRFRRAPALLSSQARLPLSAAIHPRIAALLPPPDTDRARRGRHVAVARTNDRPCDWLRTRN